jgi:hypothetical protein
VTVVVACISSLVTGTSARSFTNLAACLPITRHFLTTTLVATIHQPTTAVNSSELLLASIRVSPSLPPNFNTASNFHTQPQNLYPQLFHLNSPASTLPLQIFRFNIHPYPSTSILPPLFHQQPTSLSQDSTLSPPSLILANTCS